MITFLEENWSSVLVLAVVGGKAGKSCCGCGCNGCPSRSGCHPKREKEYGEDR